MYVLVFSLGDVFSHLADVRTTTDDHDISLKRVGLITGSKAEREPPP